MKNYKIKKIDFPAEIKKEFLVFVGDFDKKPKYLMNDIINGNIKNLALLFDLNSDFKSFEVINVIRDELKCIKVVSDYQKLLLRKKNNQKIVFENFHLKLNHLLAVKPLNNESLIKGLKSHFNIVLGSGCLKVNFKLVEKEEYKKILSRDVA